VTLLAALQSLPQIDPVDFPWAAISPELVLFLSGILVLLLDTAGRDRIQVSFVVLGAIAIAAGYAAYETGQYVLPAIVALAAVLQFALTVLWRDRPRTLGAILTALGFLGGLGTTAWQWIVYRNPGLIADGQRLVGTDSLLEGMFAVDGIALFTRFTVCIAGLVTVPLGFAYAEERRIHRGEYYPLLLFAATGMTLLAAANDLIMVFIGIEILSIALYILSGFAKRDLTSQESAIKYFLLGAFSSALLLYGIAMAYGVTGSTNIGEVAAAFTSIESDRTLVLVSMALLLVGFGFKTSLAPFHMWTPDVYQGAPTPVTGFMSGATKAAAFAAFLRVFVGGFAPLQWDWTPAVAVLAVITMLLGSVLAVVQTDVKRILGYSAVAHAGYLLLGLIASTREGASATLFYLLIYTFMSLGSFGVLSLLERRQRKAVTLDDLRGLARRHPFPASLLALFLLSLAGIPGTAGFMAKLAVFRAAIEVDQVGLVVVAVVSSVIAAFFYIRVIVAMFMDEEPEAAPSDPVVSTTGTSFGLAIAAAAIVAFGVVPGALVQLAREAASFAG
jgi:NADH-quinone oxidoreductase subunit N